MRATLLLLLTGCLWTKAGDSYDDTDSGGADSGGGCQARAWYVDADSDSYGEASYEVMACEQPEGMSSTATDCDDADEAVFPGAIEVCDGLDDDCDGLTDEEDPGLDSSTETLWFRDADGDGHGDVGDGGTLACDDPSTAYETYVLVDDDCDDTDAGIWPGNTEICGNGLDDDCDGAVGACGLSGELGLEDADATVYGDSAGGALGTTLGWGDLDGDGQPDLLVRSMNLDNDSTHVDVLGGPLRGTVARGVSAASVVSTDAAGLGAALRGDQDLDGDGWDDLLVSDASDASGSDAGVVYLFAGPLRGELPLSLAEGEARGADGEDAGAALASSSALDESGASTLIVGLPGATVGEARDGAVALVALPLAGSSDLADAPARLQSDVPLAEAGSALAPADLDGDGLDELIIGAPSANDAAGRVWLWSGPVSGAASLADAASALDGPASGAQLGYDVAAAGDVDGDGYGDALLGAPEGGSGDASGVGGAWLLPGGAALPSSLDDAAAWLQGPAYGLAGFSVSGAGDLSGDGYDDVVVGAPLLDDGGAAWVALGPLSGEVALSDAALTISGLPDSVTGASLLVGPDWTGDGAPDLGVGAPGDGRYAEDAGAVALYSWPGL